MPVKKLKDNTPYIKAVYWTGQVLKGMWHVSFKIDGVRALRLQDGAVVSRASKPLYNLDTLDFQDAEIFLGDWERSVSAVRTQDPVHIPQSAVYDLRPGKLDPRLDIGMVIDPTEAWITRMLEQALVLGYEGLVLREQNPKSIARWFKVVPKMYADVRITGWYKGKTGKNIGRLGGFTTNHGNIGGGFSDEFRSSSYDVFDSWVGKIIEVGYRETTKNGKLRFASFERERFDKDEESI